MPFRKDSSFCIPSLKLGSPVRDTLIATKERRIKLTNSKLFIILSLAKTTEKIMTIKHIFCSGLSLLIFVKGALPHSS